MFKFVIKHSIPFFKQSPVDPCMYVQNVNNQISIILFWVDNILIASKTEADLMKVKTRLNSRFKMIDLGKLSWFLGMQFKCKNGTIKMKQSRYWEDIIKVLHGRLQTMLTSLWNGYKENKWWSRFKR